MYMHSREFVDILVFDVGKRPVLRPNHSRYVGKKKQDKEPSLFHVNTGMVRPPQVQDQVKLVFDCYRHDCVFEYVALVVSVTEKYDADQRLVSALPRDEIQHSV